ncbi:hypothetical protein [Halocynthiibacter namhaensis]|uniref:hypothetical protein n=1 Tax=Halocynthiibacter namhaensis TaxID=1290553 RepID=UPI0012E00F4C|nr:hypothetical protein [Halocynthiibacter namhaensis]
MTIWFFVGIALVIWVTWDLFAGHTYLWAPISRAENPWGYWATLGIWSLIAASCFFVG